MKKTKRVNWEIKQRNIYLYEVKYEKKLTSMMLKLLLLEVHCLEKLKTTEKGKKRTKKFIKEGVEGPGSFLSLT